MTDLVAVPAETHHHDASPRVTALAAVASPAASLSNVATPSTGGLDRVSVDVERGEVTTILSRHDAAASTLLAVLTGRQTPAAGTVRVGGVDLAGLDPRALSRFRAETIGVVGPAFGVAPKLTARQNLAVALKRSGRAVDHRWLDRLVEAFELSGMLGFRNPGAADLRRERWAVARSMLGRPSIVVADGVTTGLRRTDEQRLLAYVGHAAHDLDIAVVLATRDPISASYGDRVVLLSAGRVVDDTSSPSRDVDTMSSDSRAAS